MPRIKTFLLNTLFKTIAYAPHLLHRLVARGLAASSEVIFRRRYKVAATNLTHCFPDLDEQAITSMTKACMYSTILGYLESLTYWYRPFNRHKSVHRIENLDYLIEAHAEGKGVILASAHFSILDVAGAILAQEVPLSTTYRPHNDPVINTLILQGRSWAEQYEVRDVKGYINCLKQGGILWYAPDQDLGRKHSVFAPFFGIPTATVKGLTTLAKRTQAKVLTISFFREHKRDYVLKIGKALNIPSGSFEQDATVFNQYLEQELRLHPEQYLWAHRRFKTRPDGDRGFYS